MTNRLLILSFVLFVSSCAVDVDKRLYQYNSSQSDMFWIEGLAFRFNESQKANIAIAFRNVHTNVISYRSQDVRLISFLVNIQNKSNETLIVDSSCFELLPLPNVNYVQAIDPKEMLSELRKQELFEIAGYEEDMRSDFERSLDGFILTAAIIISGSSDKRNEAIGDILAKSPQKRTKEEQQEVMDKLKKRKDYFANKVLRKTTL